ncbi:MAG TPA: PD-(D/E)XK nuclease family protein [Acidobacteriaceae bacterium]|jgi:probable DNA repair protein
MASAPQSLFPHARLATGALLLLPSDAAARRLRRLSDAAQQQAGKRAWQPAPVLSWDQWLGSLWNECIVSGIDDRILLNHAQEHQLWLGVISRAQEAGRETLSSTDTLADLAANAWRLSESYAATARLRAFAGTHDTRTFAAWAEEFARACQRGGYLSRAGLEAALTPHIAAKKLALPAEIVCTSFLQWTPAQQAFRDAVHASGCKLQDLDLATDAGLIPPDHAVLCAASEDEELRAAAVTVRHWLESSPAAKNPGAKIAVVLPDLDTDRAAVEATFREILAPELQLANADLSSKPYEFSRGEALATQPMIAVALDLARWASGSLTLGTVSALLLSPYLNEADSREESAQFDACSLRQAGILRPDIGLAWLLRLAQRSKFGASTRRWLEPLHAFLSASGGLQTPRSFTDWSEFLRRLVRSAMWPGTPANALEVHLAEAWDAALDTVATLDFSGRRVSFAEALHALERHLTQTPFAFSTGDAPIEILRPGDLAGMRFDALLFARATDANWPAAEHANPLIDWKLQASLGMHGADRSGFLERTRLATGVILDSAPTVFFSYAANNAEGRQRLSPAVANYGWPTRDAAGILAGVSLPSPIEVEVLHDTAPLPCLPSREVHGGATVLQHQAACGFRAFAEVRLRAVSLETSETGLDARERGNLLHSALSYFWNEAKSQTALRAMHPEEQQSLLADAVDHAFEENRIRSGEEDGWDSAYITLQKQRLARLLEQWIAFELQQRSPFTVVSTELKQQLMVGPLDLQVRVDRIDQIDGLEGSVLLVDYKTGFSASPKGWEGPRPDEPQLPLYALLPEEGTLAGLAFAKVRPGEGMSWQGYASHDGVLPGRNSTQDMVAMLEDWRTHLTTLAEDFAAGDASVSPKDYPITCAHCGQNLLCRLDASALLAATEDEAEEDNPRG